MTFADIRKWLAGTIYPPYREVADLALKMHREKREAEKQTALLRVKNAILRSKIRRQT